jgi:probable H4MPT-linked C1 transfer pathway protein
LIDIGSTTSDLIPFVADRPIARGIDDTTRLVAGELVYTGIERSPICALVPELPWGGSWCPVAQELFATALDAYLILGELPESPGTEHTADGRPRQRHDARRRLAKMLCLDADQFHDADAHTAAEIIRDAQLATLKKAGRRVIELQREPPGVVVTSGSGEFLAKLLAKELKAMELKANVTPVLSLTERIGAAASTCAPAYAVAVLARERH